MITQGPQRAAGFLRFFASTGTTRRSGERTNSLAFVETQVRGCAYHARPRTWLERRSAKRSVYVNGAVWLTLIIALSALAAHFAASDGAGFAP